MNVLLTGGTGNVGSRLAIPLVRRGDKVVTFDIRSEPHFASPEFGDVKRVVGNLADREAILNAIHSHGIESVFHLGAVLSASAEQEPYEAWRTNMEGMINVLEAARLGGVKKLVFSSTMATYGDCISGRLTEDAPQWPVSLYGATKVAGERLGVYYGHRFGLDFRGIRLPAVIAARGSSGGTSAYCSTVFEKCVFDGGYEFYVRPTTRAPMICIADAVTGLLALHDAPRKNLTRSMYNVFGVSPSAEEMADVIRRRLPGARLTYQPDPLQTAIVESWPQRIDDSAARHDWGWAPMEKLDDIAAEIIGELQNHCTHRSKT